MLSIDTALDRVSAMHDGALQHVGQLFARGNHDLTLHQIHVSDHFSHRMLHLDARVHLDEVKPPLLVHEKFDGARIVIADLAERLADDLSDFLSKLGRYPHRRRLFEQLLVASLNRALAFSQTDDVAVLVAQHLKFDVARVLNIFFQIEIAVAEGGRGLRLRLTEKPRQFVFVAHDAHAPSTAAGRGFENDWKFNLPRPLDCFLLRGDHAVRAGKNRYPM